MAEPATQAPPAAPDLLQREFLAERIQSSRRIDLVRFIGISAFFALFVVLGGILEHPAWIGSLERRVMYFTAAFAVVFEVALQYLADVSVGGMISTVIVLGLAAVTVLYSRTRLVKLGGGVERELAERRRMASLGTLAAGVAHEINTPLTYVVAHLALMSERLAALPVRPGTSASTSILVARLRAIEQRVADLSDANREVVERVCTIVRDLKTFSRSDEATVAAVDLWRP